MKNLMKAFLTVLTFTLIFSTWSLADGGYDLVEHREHLRAIARTALCGDAIAQFHRQGLELFRIVELARLECAPAEIRAEAVQLEEVALLPDGQKVQHRLCRFGALRNPMTAHLAFEA